jgi:hypothetical protein
VGRCNGFSHFRTPGARSMRRWRLLRTVSYCLSDRTGRRGNPPVSLLPVHSRFLLKRCRVRTILPLDCTMRIATGGIGRRPCCPVRPDGVAAGRRGIVAGRGEKSGTGDMEGLPRVRKTAQGSRTRRRSPADRFAFGAARKAKRHWPREIDTGSLRRFVGCPPC